MKGSEQLAGDSEQRARLIILPSVWAVAEKKPCLPVNGVVRKEKASMGVSPLRYFAPSVEMTDTVGGAEPQIAPLPLRQAQGPVEMTLGEGTAVALPTKADPPPTAKDDNQKAAALAADVVSVAENVKLPQPVEVAFYRKYSEAMLRRYAVMSMEAGRVPSMLGREMFRGKVTNYRVTGFDDAVIFCHDVESCLKRLPISDQKLIKRIAVQQYTHGEAAAMFEFCLRTCVTLYGDAIDKLTRQFLKVKLLEPLKACQ